MSKNIIHIIAARPNFIKAAPVISELSVNGFTNTIIHTNQHYDYMMSKVFFKDLDIPEPDYHLGIKSGTHGEQTGNALIEIEKVLLKEAPDYVVVYGDVNSTLAGALAAAKLCIPVFHIESGCRSFDNTMPEETNRIVIDSLSALLFCTEASARTNLINSGTNSSIVKLVGNTAIDSLHKIKISKNITELDYYLCTLHRPFNVDNKENLHVILSKLNNLDKLVIIPAHPRLKGNITNEYNNIKFIDPLGYLDFISYINNSKGVISDSGGIQCEATFLRIPLLTLRPTTEHLITLPIGNKLINVSELESSSFNKVKFNTPFEWDGNASKRVVEEIIKYDT